MPDFALDQKPINFPLNAWQKAVGADLPDVLAAGQVSREQVLVLGQQWRTERSPAAARSLLVASCAWGFGPTGYGPYRTAKMLNTGHAGARLMAVLTLLEDDLGEAYRSMWRTNHLDSLGPAFWTKLFYFAGYEVGSPKVQPLILDANVAAALRKKTGTAWRKGSWRTADYVEYCNLARSWADEEGVEPHDIEYRLFRAGAGRGALA